jgi:glutathione S-transferase
MAASSADAPAFTLAYFDVLALGLPTGMVAAHSGLPWRGKDPETFDWQKVKAEEAPFNQLPLLFRPGRRTVAHSAAIARAIAAMAHRSGARPGYDGSDDEDDAAVSDMLIAEALDVYAALQKGQPTCFVKMGDGGKTDTAHDELWGDTGRISLLRHFACLEKLVRDDDDVKQTGWFSKRRTAGEFFLWGVLHQVFLLDAAAFDATPKLKAFYETVASMPETKPLIEGTSPMGAMRQYFVAGPRQGA